MDLHQGVATKVLDITAATTKGVDSAAVAVFVEDPGVEAFADFAADNIKCKLLNFWRQAYHLQWSRGVC